MKTKNGSVLLANNERCVHQAEPNTAEFHRQEPCPNAAAFTVIDAYNRTQHLCAYHFQVHLSGTIFKDELFVELLRESLQKTAKEDA